MYCSTRAHLCILYMRRAARRVLCIVHLLSSVSLHSATLLHLIPFEGDLRLFLGGFRAALLILLFFLCGLQDLERAHEVVVHTHHGAGIVELPAVVGRGEDGHQTPSTKSGEAGWGWVSRFLFLLFFLLSFVSFFSFSFFFLSLSFLSSLSPPPPLSLLV